MNPLVLLAGALAWNYRRHLRGLATICSTIREHLPKPVAVGGVMAFAAWLVAHFLGGYDD